MLKFHPAKMFVGCLFPHGIIRKFGTFRVKIVFSICLNVPPLIVLMKVFPCWSNLLGTSPCIIESPCSSICLLPILISFIDLGYLSHFVPCFNSLLMNDVILIVGFYLRNVSIDVVWIIAVCGCELCGLCIGCHADREFE